MHFENNAKGMIDRLIYMNEASVRGEEVLGRLDSIAALEGAQRDDALRAYYMELYKQVYREAIIFREAAANDMSLLKEDQQLHRMNAQIILNHLTEAFNTYFAEKKIQPCEGKMLFGTDPTVIRDSVYEVCNGFKAIDMLRSAGQQRNIDLLNYMRTQVEGFATNNYKYSPTDATTDNMVAEIYVMHEERAAQYAQRDFRWKLRHPIKAIKTSWFLSRTEKLLKKVGFDKETHGVEAKERFAKEPSAVLKTQMALAKDNCKDMQEAIAQEEWRKNNPEIFVAREKLEQAKEYYENKEHPERTFRTKIAHILDKYKLSPEKDKEFSMIDSNYNSISAEFDILRSTDPIVGYKDIKFFDLCKAFLAASVQQGEPIDIKQIFKDATEYMVTELQTFSVFYEREEYKEHAKAGVMPGGKKIEAIQRRLLGMVEKKVDEKEFERIKNDMQEIVTDFTQNREQYYEKEMQLLNGEASLKEPLPMPELKEEVTNTELSARVNEDLTVSKDPIVKQN